MPIPTPDPSLFNLPSLTQLHSSCLWVPRKSLGMANIFGATCFLRTFEHQTEQLLRTIPHHTVTHNKQNYWRQKTKLHKKQYVVQKLNPCLKTKL